mgnify:CR=1 FL=1
MAKGDIIRNSFYSYRDEHTGYKVTRLTNPDRICHHPYFYNKMFTNDGRMLVYAMEIDTKRELYLLDMESETSMQLTDGEGYLCDFSPRLSGDDRFLYFCRDKKLIKMDMETLDEDIIYQSPPGWWAYDNPDISTDGKYAVTIEISEKDRLETSSGWDLFEKQWEKRPHCRIVLIDMEKRVGKVIHEESCWLGHPQFRPNHNELILFCHEGPSHRVDARLWFINADGTGMRCARPQRENEMITHEFWMQDGSLLAYVYRMQNHAGKETDAVVDPKTYIPRVENNELKQKITFLNPDTLEESILMECSKYCHCISGPQGNKIAGDGQLASQPFIYLADIHERTERILCRHDTSWKPYGTNQDSHPHPAFTPDGRKVIFTSDREGAPAIYMVETA